MDPLTALHLATAIGSRHAGSEWRILTSRTDGEECHGGEVGPCHRGDIDHGGARGHLHRLGRGRENAFLSIHLRHANSRSVSYADQIYIHDAYQQIGHDGSEGTCDCNLNRAYIGPADIDSGLVFSAPGLLMMRADATDGRGGPWEPVASGNGYSEESGMCLVSVNRRRHNAELYEAAEWDLSQEQIDGWKAGRLNVVQLSVFCDT